MQQVKTAVIGCGNFGNRRLRQLMQMEDVKIAAAVSSNGEKLRELEKLCPGLHGYSSQEELFLKEKELDAVVVCLPPACHGTLEVEAARRGIGIFTEKPIGAAMEQVWEADKEIRQNRVISSVGYQGRYNPHLKHLQKLLREQKAGLAIGRFICGRPDLAWWNDLTLSGGQLVEQVTHVFDMLRYLFGEVKEVYGMKGTKNEVDCSSVLLSFSSGETATVLSGCYLDSQTAEADVGLTIFTDKCRVEYDWDRYLKFSDQAGSTAWNFPEDQHVLCLRAFIEAVKNRDTSLIRSDYSDGLKTLRLTLAARRSLETGKPIALERFEADGAGL